MKSLLSELDDMVRVAREAGEGMTGHLRIGLLGSLSMAIVCGMEPRSTALISRSSPWSSKKQIAQMYSALKSVLSAISWVEYPSRWAAAVSIAEKIGCVPQTLHERVRKAEVDSGKRAGVPTPGGRQWLSHNPVYFDTYGRTFKVGVRAKF